MLTFSTSIHPPTSDIHRTKWRLSQEYIKVGQIVSVVEPNKPPLTIL